MLYILSWCNKNNFALFIENEDGQMWQCVKFYFWHFDETYSYINIVRSINPLNKCIFYDYILYMLCYLYITKKHSGFLDNNYNS